MYKKIYLICPMLLLGLVLTSVANAQDPNLVGWWNLDETFGTTAYDSSGNGNNGTLAGDARWVDGRIHGALALDGNGDYVECVTRTGLDVRNFITITMWIKTDDAGNNENNSYLMKGEFTYGIRHTTANNIMFYIYSGGYHSAQVPVTNSFNGLWHHLVGIYDGSALKLYIDGELKASATHSGAINRDTNYLVNFGRNSQGDSANQWYYAGDLDDVRIYNRALSQVEIMDLLHPELASMPNPLDGAKLEWSDVVLSWTPGVFADKHDVYFGTVLDDVTQASRTDRRGVLVSQDHDVDNCDPPGLLELDKTYYWRIDEVNTDATITKGKVWSFTVPFAFPVEQIIATASSSNKNNTGPVNTINSSGLDDNDLHSKSDTAMWLSSAAGPQPTWIRYEFDRIYKLHEMWVWNYNGSFESILGFGLKNVTVEHSIDGINWTALSNVPEFARAPGKDGYARGTVVSFDDTAAKYVKITANSSWGGRSQYGLSEVRFLTIPVHAREPNPAPGETGVALDAVLKWRAGREAASHEIYFSSDKGAVEAGTALVGKVSTNSFGLNSLRLELGKTYYWKVNEVNEAMVPSAWEGDVWDFTTSEYLTVDDFEQYDDLCNRIFYSWVDGYGHSGDTDCSVAPYGGNKTGSTVGNFTAPFAEQTIVNSGNQSMPLEYNNSINPYYSETHRSWAAAQDWTRGGAKVLSLWFYGAAENVAEQLYIAVEDSSGSIKVVNYPQPEAVQTASWQEWRNDLTSFAGVDFTKIKTMYIGVGNPPPANTQAGGSGTLYIDDIRLYLP